MAKAGCDQTRRENRYFLARSRAGRSVDEVADAVLTGHFAASTEIDRPAGCVRFQWAAGTGAPGEAVEARAIGAEQSNTSVVLDERLVLKAFRKLEIKSRTQLGQRML